ncbi:DMSO/TMAO reductase YedYZ molybdopterin-dependent catalytic subunit [Arthrobacter sp. PvP102]|jgi:DMSO/TMAO reductase YedYZ molybdopterin-dependent catalytic subunit|uniref:molybdopterin-dependent oxidoreductase n=1 Tax=unclassified Arthrobacter TaxID=235627 RepID=UPI001AE96BA8|nr:MULTISPECIES: molybdopterin-dependent oxidoreductase [unclassified Arthrobacter]MBP1232753.1 DMSO/TMAO reductase YedYZ molybdopterin-dependent catalytic subunit [Arthrobacter sp. PvP103]MBP1237888.1 DMSO/TMAO reductase YedYZ molybdopterin-dependent catalytic subunit [Arthrobacter sp. PvP102]
MKKLTNWLKGPTALAALAGVAAAAVVLSVAELIGAFFTARATPLIALGSTFIDFTPPWLKDFAIATFGTNDKAALFAGMGLTIFLLACVLGVVAYRKWSLGVAGVLLMGAVIVASVVTRASVEPLDAIPSLIGTAAGLVVLRLLITRLWRMRSWPGVAADVAAKDTERPATTRRAFFAASGITAVAAAIAATGGRLLSAARSNIAQARESLQLPSPAKAAPAVPAGVQSAAPGVTPWITPNNEFYRIDTALSVPEINAEEWELRVHGLVEQEVTLTFQDLLDAELIESHVTLTCVSNPVGGNLAGNAKWLGLPLREVLKMARPKDGADMVLSTSEDGFSASTPLEVLQDDRDAMLAIGMNGEPLPLEHGYPVRMVVPGLYGFVSATKWVVDLEVTRFADSKAYWTDRGWSERGPIKTMARVEVPKSFAQVPAGKVAIGGTAWAQTRGITKVEVQIDNGPWTEAVLSTEASVVTWRQWSFEWDATPGPHYIKARATDGTGEVQTDKRADPVPDGASGWQSVMVTVQ